MKMHLPFKLYYRAFGGNWSAIFVVPIYLTDNYLRFFWVAGGGGERDLITDEV